MEIHKSKRFLDSRKVNVFNILNGTYICS